MENRKEDVEELIIQGLGHRERRNILKIISLAPNGAIYSDILGELGLNTGRMNYHLRHWRGWLSGTVIGGITSPLSEREP